MPYVLSVQLFVTPWTTAHQAPLSMGFSRQEYWNELPFPSPSPPKMKYPIRYVGFPGRSAVKNLTAMQKMWVRSLIRKIPWRREQQPTPVRFLLDSYLYFPSKYLMDRGAWWATVHGVAKRSDTI